MSGILIELYACSGCWSFGRATVWLVGHILGVSGHRTNNIGPNG